VVSSESLLSTNWHHCTLWYSSLLTRTGRESRQHNRTHELSTAERTALLYITFNLGWCQTNVVIPSFLVPELVHSQHLVSLPHYFLIHIKKVEKLQCRSKKPCVISH